MECMGRELESFYHIVVSRGDAPVAITQNVGLTVVHFTSWFDEQFSLHFNNDTNTGQSYLLKYVKQTVT